MCIGSEQELFQCLHDSLDVGNCNHREDAGVECVEGQKKYHMEDSMLSMGYCEDNVE